MLECIAVRSSCHRHLHELCTSTRIVHAPLLHPVANHIDSTTARWLRMAENRSCMYGVQYRGQRGRWIKGSSTARCFGLLGLACFLLCLCQADKTMLFFLRRPSTFYFCKCPSLELLRYSAVPGYFGTYIPEQVPSCPCPAQSTVGGKIQKIQIQGGQATTGQAWGPTKVAGMAAVRTGLAATPCAPGRNSYGRRLRAMYSRVPLSP